MIGKNKRDNNSNAENLPFSEDGVENNRAMAKAMNIAESFRRGNSRFDPLGSWTGVPTDGNDQPTQDADDL